jgi:hypothetical protein
MRVSTIVIGPRLSRAFFRGKPWQSVYGDVASQLLLPEIGQFLLSLSAYRD